MPKFKVEDDLKDPIYEDGISRANAVRDLFASTPDIPSINATEIPNSAPFDPRVYDLLVNQTRLLQELLNTVTQRKSTEVEKAEESLPPLDDDLLASGEGVRDLTLPSRVQKNFKLGPEALEQLRAIKFALGMKTDSGTLELVQGER